MKQEIGALFLFAAIGALAWWHQSHMRQTALGNGPPNVVTTNAGTVLPEAQQSHTTEDGSDWDAVPYYLKGNYPSERGGQGVVPSLTTWGLSETFNPQEIPPQL